MHVAIWLHAANSFTNNSIVMHFHSHLPLKCQVMESSILILACSFQAGAWDVDDTGLEYMPNKDVAERIQKKVLSMYIRDSVISTGLLAAFCFWPL